MLVALLSSFVGVPALPRRHASTASLQELERTQGKAADVASVNVPLEALYGDKEPTMMIRTQHATCPDAQCPRAKMENVGYSAKGYNLLFADPFTGSPGVDPGFTDHAGGLIWHLRYETGRETADGRFEIPDHLLVEHNVGCSLQFESSESETLSEVEEMNEHKVSASGAASFGLVAGTLSAKFTGSTSWRAMQRSSEVRRTTKVTSTADCVVYHVKMPKYEQKPRITSNFALGLKAVNEACSGNDGLCGADGLTDYSDVKESGDVSRLCEKAVGSAFVALEESDPYYTSCKAFWDFFSEFGTSWMDYVQMGARFGMTSRISSRKLQSLREHGLQNDYAASVAWNKKADPQVPCPKKTKCTGPGYDKDDKEGYEEDDKEQVFKIVAEKDDEKSASSAEDDLERVVESAEVSAGYSGNSESATSTSFEESTESNSIVAIGAKPSDSALEWAQQTEDENMPISYNLRSICELFQENFIKPEQLPEDYQGAGAAYTQGVAGACYTALAGYCKALDKTLGNLHCDFDRNFEPTLPPEPDCETDLECDNLNGIPQACREGTCVLHYDRITELVMVSGRVGSDAVCRTHDSTFNMDVWFSLYNAHTTFFDSRTAQPQEGDYMLSELPLEPVTIYDSAGTPDNSLNHPTTEPGQLRGGTSYYYTRLCALHTSHELAKDKGVKSGDNSETVTNKGICAINIHYNRAGTSHACSGDHRRVVRSAGFSNGDFNAGDVTSTNTFSLFLCVSYCGCEGRPCPEDSDTTESPESPTKAIGHIVPVRYGGGGCTSLVANWPDADGSLKRIATSTGSTGDINQFMNSGGSVHICTAASNKDVPSLSAR
jgi:hypothetical protein